MDEKMNQDHSTRTTDRFDECFVKLWLRLEDEQRAKGYDGPVAFRYGVIHDEEDYKYEIVEKAKKRLASADINDPKQLNDTVRDCLWEHVNLISPEHVIDATGMIHDAPKTAHRVLRDIFTSDEEHEKDAFNAAKAFFRKGSRNYYDVISYLFFLKDSDRFVPLRPQSYVKRFNLLGKNAACTTTCTWDGYQEYLAVTREIQDRLIENELEDVTLLDAQTFIWMLWKIIEHPVKAPADPLPGDPLVTRVIAKGKEGGRIAYYSTKYERDRDLRNAVARRDNFTCQACGLKFSDKYGPLGDGFIEVHHTIPLHTRDEERYTDPKELVAVCPNCHRMIHRKKNSVLTIEELKSLLLRFDSQTSTYPTK